MAPAPMMVMFTATRPRRGSRATVDRNSSRSSICGEWPDFSNTTSFAFGIRSRDGLRGADRGDPVAPADGDERGHRDRGELRLEVVARACCTGSTSCGTRDGRCRPRRAAAERDRVVLVVVERDDLRPARLEVLVVADPPGPVTVEVVPVDLDPVLVAGVLVGELQVARVGGGVAEHDRLDVLGVGDGVLEGDEPAVRAARDDDLVRSDPLPQAVDVGGPLGVRVRGTPSLCPQPRASKTTTRNRSASGPKVALGSASEPMPPPPWWAISTGPSSGPITSTFSSQSLMVTFMLVPPWRSSARSRHRAG